MDRWCLNVRLSAPPETGISDCRCGSRRRHWPDGSSEPSITIAGSLASRSVRASMDATVEKFGTRAAMNRLLPRSSAASDTGLVTRLSICTTRCGARLTRRTRRDDAQSIRCADGLGAGGHFELDEDCREVVIDRAR